jgi:hypothetical protein
MFAAVRVSTSERIRVAIAMPVSVTPLVPGRVRSADPAQQRQAAPAVTIGVMDEIGRYCPDVGLRPVFLKTYSSRSFCSSGVSGP